MFWSIIWNALIGNLGGIFSTLGKFSDNETTRAKAGIEATSSIAKAQIENDSKRFDYFRSFQVTQWLIAAALIPPIIHQGMIYLDSVPLFWHQVGSWRVPSAPPPYDEREWLMIASLLGISTVASSALGFIRIILRK